MIRRIPRRIIQTAKRRDLPLKERAVSANLRHLNPEYEWLFFDDHDVAAFVAGEFPQYREVFESFRFPIQKYDFFRYLAVFHFGGFYFDLDVLLAKGLSSLEHHSAVFPFEGLTFSRLLRGYGMDWEIGNYAFGAVAGHPFLESVIANCVRAQREPRWVEAMMPGVPRLSRRAHQVLYSTGPGLVSRTFAENRALASTVTVLFPDDISEPSSWHLFGDFGIHLMQGSWRPERGRLYRRIALRWEAAVAARLRRQSQRRGKTRTFPIDVEGSLRKSL